MIVITTVYGLFLGIGSRVIVEEPAEHGGVDVFTT